MKLATFTAMAVLLSAGYAFAGGGAPVPEGSQAGDPKIRSRRTSTIGTGRSPGSPSFCFTLGPALCRAFFVLIYRRGDLLKSTQTKAKK
jgi:hypothetical protein